MKTKDGTPHEVSEQGSLGLLALGYIGLQIWREKRKETQRDIKETEGSDN